MIYIGQFRCFTIKLEKIVEKNHLHGLIGV